MERLLDELREYGIVRWPQPIDRDVIGDITDKLRKAPCYNGHVRVYSNGKPHKFDEMTGLGYSVWCHHMRDIVLSPLFEIACGMTPIAAEYLEAKPHLYSLNGFWVAPADAPMRDLQTWHRDKDDERFLCLFVYGTDVRDYRDGPHCYKRCSHTGEAKDVISVCGPAGTMFFSDGRGLHMGAVPTRGERLLLWARWGISERPASYDWDALEAVDKRLLGERYPTDEKMQDIIKLVVA